MRRALTSTLLVAWILLIASSRRAASYPHFQLATGSSRCAQCHLSPAGGGLLTAYGRDESADTISTGGNGGFLHGAITLPESVSIGGDLRVATLANDTGSSDGTELAAFPMQADLALAIRPSSAWTIVAVAGARGRVRSGEPTSIASDASAVDGPSLGSYVISREHYVMWRPDESAGIYVRAGRFFAPYGLRPADHTAYIRRYVGMNLQEETYGLGAGWLGDSLELHATGFVYDPIQGATRKEAGGALLVETQRPTTVIGASARGSYAATSTRLGAGAFVKQWLAEAVLIQAELDGVRELFDGPGDRWQLAAYAGPTVFVRRGLQTGVAYQAFAEDLQIQSVLRQGVDAWLAYFPLAHVELMASARAQRIGPHEHAYLGMLQLHYYL
jgi:hypothetical protein